jgi:hypothetical protein
MVARDTVVAARIAAHVRAAGKRALVIAGEHEYGVQLDGQLRLAGLPRANADADLVVLCGLAGHPEIERAREPFDHMVYGAERARRGAELVLETGGDLRALRAAGGFDEHGDPLDPPVWLWRAGRDWTLRPERLL